MLLIDRVPSAPVRRPSSSTSGKEEYTYPQSDAEVEACEHLKTLHAIVSGEWYPDQKAEDDQV